MSDSFTEDDLRRVTDALVDRMARDMIIGFHFEGRDLSRIKLHEFELARKHVFGTGPYTGRGLATLHRPLRINRGQFQRRMAILRLIHDEHDVPADVRQAWVAHDASMENAITDGTDCVPGL